MAKTSAKNKKTTKTNKKSTNKKKNESLYVVIAILTIAVIGLSVGYAALSATLNITINKVTQSSITWNVQFKEETVTPTEYGTSSVGRTCGSATSGGQAVTVSETSLSKPGDGCRWQLRIQNTGDITAMLKSFTSVAPTISPSSTCTGAGAGSATMVCGNITYKLTTDADGNTLVTTSGIGTIASGGYKDVYLFATYTGSSTVSSVITQSGAQFQLYFEQN